MGGQDLTKAQIEYAITSSASSVVIHAFVAVNAASSRTEAANGSIAKHTACSLEFLPTAVFPASPFCAIGQVVLEG